MTRDSLVLKVVTALAIILGVVGATMKNPADYGISDITYHWLMLANLIIAALSAWLGASPLASKKDR